MVGVGEWVACSGLELGTSATSDSVLLLRDQYHGRTDIMRVERTRPDTHTWLSIGELERFLTWV